MKKPLPHNAKVTGLVLLLIFVLMFSKDLLFDNKMIPFVSLIVFLNIYTLTSKVIIREQTIGVETLLTKLTSQLFDQINIHSIRKISMEFSNSGKKSYWKINFHSAEREMFMIVKNETYAKQILSKVMAINPAISLDQLTQIFMQSASLNHLEEFKQKQPITNPKLSNKIVLYIVLAFIGFLILSYGDHLKEVFSLF